MQRRRSRREFDKFPKLEVDKEAVHVDIREREYMSKFKEHHVRTGFYLALLGMTEEQMAVVFDVNVGTLASWKNKHPTFHEAIQKGKEQADAEVVYSLYQAAIGFEHPSEQIFCSKEKIYAQNERGQSYLVKETPKVIRVPIVKKYPPSVKAALRWLEIRQPVVWSERQDTKVKLALTQNNFNLGDLTMEQLKLLQSIGMQSIVVEEPQQQFHTTAQRALKEINIQV